MNVPDRRKALEEAYKSISSDLRFSDTKAVFIGAVIAAWTGAVNGAVGLGDPANVWWVRTASEAYIVTACLASLAVILSIVPQWPVSEDALSVHQIKPLATEYEALRHDRELLRSTVQYRLDRKDRRGRDGYDSSLLIDHARIAHRCRTKYRFVRCATLLGAIGIVLGTAAIILKHRLPKPAEDAKRWTLATPGGRTLLKLSYGP